MWILQIAISHSSMLNIGCAGSPNGYCYIDGITTGTSYDSKQHYRAYLSTGGTGMQIQPITQAFSVRCIMPSWLLWIFPYQYAAWHSVRCSAHYGGCAGEGIGTSRSNNCYPAETWSYTQTSTGIYYRGKPDGGVHYLSFYSGTLTFSVRSSKIHLDPFGFDNTFL